MTQIADAFFASACRNPDKQAIWCDGISVTYREFSLTVASGIELMRYCGIRRGEHVGVLLPNCAEFVSLMLIAADLGIALIPLSPALPTGAVHTAFCASDVKHIIGTHEAIDRLISSVSHDFSFANGTWMAIDEAQFLDNLTS